MCVFCLNGKGYLISCPLRSEDARRQRSDPKYFLISDDYPMEGSWVDRYGSDIRKDDGNEETTKRRKGEAI